MEEALHTPSKHPQVIAVMATTVTLSLEITVWGPHRMLETSHSHSFFLLGN